MSLLYAQAKIAPAMKPSANPQMVPMSSPVIVGANPRYSVENASPSFHPYPSFHEIPRSRMYAPQIVPQASATPLTFKSAYFFAMFFSSVFVFINVVYVLYVQKSLPPW